MKAYRLCGRHRDPKDASGASRRGGRWNSPGTAILYCASTLSLACLEFLVHVRDLDNLPLLSGTEILIPDQHIKSWASRRYDDHRTHAILQSLVLSREIGDDWINYRSGPLSKPRTAEVALEVPSAVVPQEPNYLINPLSPDFHEVVWSEPKPFNVDARLLFPRLR